MMKEPLQMTKPRTMMINGIDIEESIMSIYLGAIKEQLRRELVSSTLVRVFGSHGNLLCSEPVHQQHKITRPDKAPRHTTIRFSLINNNNEMLKGLDVAFEAGKYVCIVGGSRAGEFLFLLNLPIASNFESLSHITVLFHQVKVHCSTS